MRHSEYVSNRHDRHAAATSRNPRGTGSFCGMVRSHSPEELSSSEASIVEDEPFLDMADAEELQDKPVVLVVEDELLVRILQVDILREAGFRIGPGCG